MDNLDSVLTEQPVALGFVVTHRRAAVMRAVDFNRQPQLGAIEIENVPANRELSAEFEAEGSSIAKPAPQTVLCASRRMTHLLRVLPECWTGPYHRKNRTSAGLAESL